MSGTPDDDRLEELREQKMQELREQAEGQQGGQNEAREEAARQQAEAKQEAMLKQYLTDGARQRLNAVEMSKPDFAESVKKQIVALAQSGRIQNRIDEEQMRDLLKELQPESKSFDIRRR
ncbi:DNA-binding protein [Halobellus sp. GM3]|uniref:DNA-binding protein n=1 Tax=Halobellus sp. GM3 TaxID=3458410 RepID=UPI00403E136B